MPQPLARHFAVELTPEVEAERQPDAPVDAAILERWSPRAFSPREVEPEKLDAIFEAARWAASSYNEQPWRFLLARSSEDRKKFVDFLLPANQVWAKDAPILLVVLAKKTFSHNGQPNKTYQFCTGAAAAYLTLACTQQGLIAHGMAGFDADMARATLGVPSDFDLMAVFAVGYHGDKSLLPSDVAEREVPSGRRPACDSVMEGHFTQSEEKRAEAETEIDSN